MPVAAEDRALLVAGRYLSRARFHSAISSDIAISMASSSGK
jgi:hypothetical protein